MLVYPQSKEIVRHVMLNLKNTASGDDKTPQQKVELQKIRLPKGGPETTGYPDMHNFFSWVNYVKDKDSLKGNYAVGKPTAPIFHEMAKIGIEYWQKATSEAISYGHPKGEHSNKQLAASGLSKIYNVEISPKHILFTVGGKSARYSMLKSVQDYIGDKKIVTTLPYYMDYAGYACDEFVTNLAFVDLAKGNTATLIAKLLQDSLEKIKDVGAFLFCDPNNPMGTTLQLEEWQKVGKVLTAYPKTPIILDEAYAEMVFDRPHVSLLTACPYLYDRIMILRSAAKGFSAAGERMALLICPNEQILQNITYHNMSIYIHAPKSLQYMYARLLNEISPNKYEQIANFYKGKVNRVHHELQKLNLLPSCFGKYKPNATFYVIADLSYFKGKRIHPQAQYILKKTSNTIETDLDLSFHMLFKYGIALTPLSYFGFAPESLLTRITCSMEDEEIDDLIEILKLAKESA